MSQESSGWFTKLQYLEIALTKDESNKTLMDKVKFHANPHESVANEVRFNITFQSNLCENKVFQN